MQEAGVGVEESHLVRPRLHHLGVTVAHCGHRTTPQGNNNNDNEQRGDGLAQWLERWTGDPKIEGFCFCFFKPCNCIHILNKVEFFYLLIN